MTTTIVHPSIENLQQFSDSFDIEKLLQSDRGSTVAFSKWLEARR
ncbi:hypothetical protein [Nostoc sp.]